MKAFCRHIPDPKDFPGPFFVDAPKYHLQDVPVHTSPMVPDGVMVFVSNDHLAVLKLGPNWDSYRRGWW